MMRRVWTIARQELRGYFDHPTAYVVAIAFLALALFLAFKSLYGSGLATLRPLFDWLPILLSVFVPAATMRALAEERRSRTLEWLTAQPLTDAEIVLGKALGSWMFVLVAISGTLPLAIGVFATSRADPGVLVAEYVGAAFLAALFVAIGVFASSLTRNQVTSFIIGSALSFLLVLIGLPVVQTGLEPAIGAPLARLSVVEHFANISRGVVDARDALYFVSTTLLFVMLAIGAISRQRLSPRGSSYRRLRVGMLVVLALVVVGNALGGRIRGRLDLTRGALYTLAEGTKQLLGDLDDIVQVKLFVSRALPPEVNAQLRDVRDLLADMREASNGTLAVVEVDPDDDEIAKSEATSLGINPIEFNVMRTGEVQMRRAYYGMAIVYGDGRRAMPVIERTDDLEFRMASAIAGLTQKTRPRVAFAHGFGARTANDIEGLSQVLGERYEVGVVALAESLPASLDADSLDALVLAGPTTTLDARTVDHIRRFVDTGGSALLLLDPIVFDRENATPIPVHTGLEAMLEARGVRLQPQILFDLTSHEQLTLGRSGSTNVVVPYPLWPVALPVGANIVTRSLKSLTMAWAGALEILDSSKVEPLLRTSASGGLRSPERPITPDQDWTVPNSDLGVKTVAVAIGAVPSGARGHQGRLIVVSDVSFLDAQFLRANPENMIFLANAVDWLTQNEALIRIRSKERGAPPLVIESESLRSAFQWGNLLGVPLVFALIGAVRAGGRRRRERRRWGDIGGSR
jgi:ABC-type uncharacterized transport system involved in gliding motility auxiliary subunit/ABC-type transport system involved in multi-copper enzyme maturation permease subunit